MKTHKEIHIWHHNDNDGRCAAYIAAHAMAVKYGPENTITSFYEMTYDKPPTFEHVRKDHICIIVDFSFHPDVFEDLKAIGPRTIWIDHHKTAIEAMANVKDCDGLEISGLRRTTDSATLLTWEYFHPEQPVPYAVQLVDDHDAWKHKLQESMNFLAGSALFDRAPAEPQATNFWYATVFNNSWKQVCNYGVILNQYTEKQNASKLKALGWIGLIDTQLGPMTCLCLNGVRGSQAFQSTTQDHAILVAYEHKGDRFTVSLYTEKKEIDVSAIAKLHGGGGHAGAAGFICEELPITFIEPYKA